MNDLLIIGIPMAVLLALYLLSFEKRLKQNHVLLVIILIVTFGYCGYLIGSAVEYDYSRVLLIGIFIIGGVWRFAQFVKVSGKV